jgi:hypothetical protein
VAILAVLVACASASGASPDPKRMVLRLQDMPTGFKVGKHRYYSTPEAVASTSKVLTTADFRSWGYVTGYEADFARDPSLADLASGGAIQIISITSIYRSSVGAHRSMVKSKQFCRKPPFQEVSVGARLGHEAHMCSYTETQGGFTAQVYVVVWRKGRFKASIFLAGLKGGTSASEAVSLAKVQLGRMHG